MKSPASWSSKIGFILSAAGSDALKKLKITEDTRFVARYEKEETDKFIVSFEVDGVIKALEKVNKGGKVANVPEDPVASGKTFMGWKIDGKGAGYGKDAVKALAIEKNTAFVASFRDDKNIIPSNPTDPVKPGYAKVTFDKGAHGELKGNTVFQVKKDMEIDLTSEAPSVKPAEGWKFTEWDKDLKQTFTADTTKIGRAHV